MIETLGQSIPANTAHALSVSLPTWEANVGYEESAQWVVERMTTGYPRFFIHRIVQELAKAVVKEFGATSSEEALIFPSHACASRCFQFLKTHSVSDQALDLRLINLRLKSSQKVVASAVLLPHRLQKLAKTFWQHSGEGVSSRQAEHLQDALDSGLLELPEPVHRLNSATDKGLRRYKNNQPTNDKFGRSILPSTDQDALDIRDIEVHVEERFGRNLSLTHAENAKLAIRRRIAATLAATRKPGTTENLTEAANVSSADGISANDVYLFPCGMNAIFHSHRFLQAFRGQMKAVCYGFPYVDTRNILEKFGAGCLFYGFGNENELDDLEQRCLRGERFLGLFCEFPSNPLLNTPNLKRIRSLAKKFDFPVVVDETIGNFINVNVLPYADIVVSSLTKIFAGECNVMGGSLVLNPKSRYYEKVRSTVKSHYEDCYWAEDAIFMERNSRDFEARIHRINGNADMICDILLSSPIIKKVYYPRISGTRHNYESCRRASGGYGGLLSVTFKTMKLAIKFFDNIETAKGPSLGTNFTLISPYVILAHYQELSWASQFGVEADLIRMSVGLEEPSALASTIRDALRMVELDAL